MEGLDTGFFFDLWAGRSGAQELWRTVTERDDPAAAVPSRSTSCPGKLSGLVGRLDHEYAAAVIERAGVALRQAGVDPVGVLSRGARITHGIGLPMADALIAASLEHVDCARVHTSDSDFEDYKGPMEVVFL